MRAIESQGLAARILERCVPDGDCLIWQGATNSRGYGCVSGGRKGNTLLAHRVVFTEEVGPIEDGMTVDHMCTNKLCMNVFHMQLVTASENSKLKNERQTHCKNGHALSGENLRLNKKKTGYVHRVCRTCQAEAMRQHRANQRETRLAPKDVAA